MKRYSLYSIAVVLLVALVWLGCGKDQIPLAPDAGQQPQVAAKILEDPPAVERFISVEGLKERLFATLRDGSGRVVERRVNIFYRSGEAGVECSKCDRKKCYSFFARGARWKTTEPYLLDPTNEDGLSPGFVARRIRRSLNAWDRQVRFNIFGRREPGDVDGADLEWPDEKNEVLFVHRIVDETGAEDTIIAVAIVWGIWDGPVRDREIVEWDMVFNDYFKWGNAGRTDETGLGDPEIMDLQNIAAHEAGHAAGLDHPNRHCTEETMYAFAENGETKKRTLHTGDKIGIKKLYKGTGKRLVQLD